MQNFKRKMNRLEILIQNRNEVQNKFRIKTFDGNALNQSPVKLFNNVNCDLQWRNNEQIRTIQIYLSRKMCNIQARSPSRIQKSIKTVKIVKDIKRLASHLQLGWNKRKILNKNVLPELKKNCYFQAIK
ncbi:unnamed protein product [Owenia fusiformis]|uniref:Uncharacterized protein n=1 Tax=Owenia fusiformis TaxID=6347 RepID=A0A8S4MX78_OWEFU|nr:unnamed protein product [Owenia fusiformis]